VVGEDHLGHGKTVVPGGMYGYFCQEDPATVVVRDVHRLKKLMQGVYPDVPYIILGHSMGSFILRNYMCRYGSGIAAAIIMGTGMLPKGLIKVSKGLANLQKNIFGSRYVSNILNVCAFGTYNKKIESVRTAFDWLTRDEEIVDRYVEDPLCGFTFTVNGFQTLFELIDRLYKRENLENMPADLPVLVVSGGEDPVGDYGKGVQKAADSLRLAGLKNVQMKLYEQDRHEILNELDRAQVMQDIYDWIMDVNNLKGGDC
jgi:alpha-beta hydrolase superfamily lysophospholipase